MPIKSCSLSGLPESVKLLEAGRKDGDGHACGSTGLVGNRHHHQAMFLQDPEPGLRETGI
jgi:hypothetical protein